MAGLQVRTLIEQHPHDIVIPFEDRARDGTLAPFVKHVHVGTFVEQHVDGLQIAIVRGQHQESVALVVCQVHGYAGGEILLQFRRFALSREVKHFGGEGERFGWELADVGWTRLL